MRALIGSCLLWLAGLPTHAADTLSPELVFERAAPSIVTVYAGGRDGAVLGQGSGVVVRSHHVLTNCHVLKGAEYVGLKSGQSAVTAELIEVRIEHDLCLLRAPLLDAPPLALGSARTLRTGQRVFALGAPLGLELTFTEGLVSSLRREGEWPLIQTSAPVSPGSSGGALLDPGGRLVGIVTFQVSDDERRSENLNFALPIDLLREFRTLAR